MFRGVASRRGVLLVNLGTPASPRRADVRRYLREFLSDPRVIDTSAIVRAALLYGVVLPFRPRVAADAYAKIWMREGSPLLVYGERLRDALARQLGAEYQVDFAMRYGDPSIQDALASFAEKDIDHILVLPLFPQFASSSTGSALEAIYRAAGRFLVPPKLEVLPAFYDDPLFIRELAARARSLSGERPDHLLVSFHGLPERQILKADPSGRHCLHRADCCERPDAPVFACYRAQCRVTARGLATELGLGDGDWSLSFQSRLGRTPWLRPYTDEILVDLHERGVRRLAVSCPAFVADCLETLEEIGIRAREQWLAMGGEELQLIPSLNDSAGFVNLIAGWVRARAA